MTRLLDQPADEAPTAVLDFETTGLTPQGHRVIEVAVMRVDNGSTREFVTLVDPRRPIPSDATAVHGISDAMVAGQPTFAGVAADLGAILDGAVLVAHNADFDLSFLLTEHDRAGLAPPRVGPVVCTLALARHVFGLPRCNLHALAARVSVSHKHAHRALSDVQATLGVYRAMLKSMSRDRRPTVGEVIAEVDRLRKGGPGRQSIITRVKQAAASGELLTIDYTSRLADPEREPHMLVTRRTIEIRKLRMPYIEAHCHLRGEDRVFRVDRIRQVVEGSAGD